MREDDEFDTTGQSLPRVEVENGRVPEASVRRLLAELDVLRHLSDIVSLIDANYMFLYASRTVGGRTQADVVGSSVLDHIPENTRESFKEAFDRTLASGEPQLVEATNNEGYWWENRLVPVHDGSGRRFVFVTSADITARKLAEQSLSERESRLRCAVEASGVGTFTWDRGRDELVWDEGLSKLVGLAPEASPTTLCDVLTHVHVEDREHVAGHMRRCEESGVLSDFELRVQGDDGEIRHLLCRGSAIVDGQGRVVGVRGGMFDITDRKRLEERLRHVQKMDAIGQLTAGIAHNFNNLLSIVLPNVEICRATAPLMLQRRLEDIEHAAERATELVRQLMLFARYEVGTPKASADVAAIAERTVSICRSTFDRGIAIELSVEPGLPPVWARAGEIEQVLLNICLNARDALEGVAHEQPRITLEVEAGGADAVRVRVRDNGCGMDAEARARVFEPFFTTKDVGKGTGLGLASAYGIVIDHQGRLTCDSAPGVGTTFTLELPISRETSTADEGRSGGIQAAPSGSETILLVDDEELVRRALRDILEGAGFHVLEAEDGGQALALVRARAIAIDLVVLDRSMPRMSGEQVVARMRELGFEAPVLMLTGYPGVDAALPGVRAVMTKPARSGALLQVVRQLLDEG